MIIGPTGACHFKAKPVECLNSLASKSSVLSNTFPKSQNHANLAVLAAFPNGVGKTNSTDPTVFKDPPTGSPARDVSGKSPEVSSPRILDFGPNVLSL